jgi:DNA-binding IclR family transcriptional regulator
MKGPTRQSERHVEAVLAALHVMDCFLDVPTLGIKQIMDATGFTRNRVMRLTGTLVHKGYLALDEASRAYSLGTKIISLSKVYEPHQEIVMQVKPVLKQIAYHTGESVSFYIREGFDRVVLVRQEGTQAIRYTVSEGQRMDLHAGAGGKVLLAFASDDVVSSFLSKRTMEKHTQQTITTKKKLLAELKKIQKQGFASSRGERVPDAYAIAAPVFDAAGGLIGALGVAGPAGRFTSSVRKSHQRMILDHARRLSKQLGWK